MNLHEKALLVRLSISLPGNSRTDARLTNETLVRYAMKGKAGRWLKQIFPDEAYTPLVKSSGEIRTRHYELTLPWSDEGYRILPSAMHQDYCDEMRKLRRKYEDARDTFLSSMAAWEAWAKDAHNGTFDVNLYEFSKVERKFGFTLDFNPVPTGAALPFYVQDDDRAETDAKVQAAESAAQADLWHRLADPLKAMAERLSDPKAIFRDSLVSNLGEIVALLPKLNLGADPKLVEFAEQAKLLTVAPENTGAQAQSLRDNASKRAETAARAKEILSHMAGYMPTAE